MGILLKDANIIDMVNDGPYLGSVLIDESSGTISKILTDGEPADAPVEEEYDCTGLTIVPGFVDAHCHLNYRDIHEWYQFEIQKSLPEATIDSVINAALVLRRGFTTIRDCGSRAGHTIDVRNAIAAGDILGPRAQVAGQIVSTPGGLGDNHPSHAFAPNEYRFSQAILVSEPWEARSVVRRQLKDGVDWIKATLTGTGSNPNVPAERNDLPEDVFAAVMAEAREQGARVIAHVESLTSVKRAARHGATSVEHGVFIDEEAIDLLLANQVVLVPTLAQYTAYAEQGLDFGRPRRSVEAHQRIHDDHVRSTRLAYERGVPIAAGGDAGGAHFPQGSAAREMSTFVDLIGMSPAEALRAGTINGARLLGLEDHIGTIEPGKAADLVVLQADPLNDIHVLDHTDTIVTVFQNGHPVPPPPTENARLTPTTTTKS